jgi:hypothetical protein
MTSQEGVCRASQALIKKNKFEASLFAYFPKRLASNNRSRREMTGLKGRWLLVQNLIHLVLRYFTWSF